MNKQLKTLESVKAKLSRPSICEFVENNYEEVIRDLWETTETFDDNDYGVILDKPCIISIIPSSIIEEYMFYRALNGSLEDSDKFVISDDAKQRITSLRSGAKHYMDITVAHSRENRDNKPAVMILQEPIDVFDNEYKKTEFYFGLPRYIKTALKIKRKS